MNNIITIREIIPETTKINLQEVEYNLIPSNENNPESVTCYNGKTKFGKPIEVSLKTKELFDQSAKFLQNPIFNDMRFVNYPSRTLDLSGKSIQQITSEQAEMAAQFSDNAEILPSNLTQLSNRVKKISKNKIIDCIDASYICLDLINKYNKTSILKINASRESMFPGQHSVVKTSLPKEEGPAVYIDPWSNSLTLENSGTQLYDYTGQILVTKGFAYPVIREMNLERQRFRADSDTLVLPEAYKTEGKEN